MTCISTPPIVSGENSGVGYDDVAIASVVVIGTLVAPPGVVAAVIKTVLSPWKFAEEVSSSTTGRLRLPSPSPAA